MPPNGETAQLMSQVGIGGILEAFGGLLLLIGLFTRPVAPSVGRGNGCRLFPVFNDGIAFRYEFPEQLNRKSFILYEETTTFNVQGDPRVLTLFLPSHTSSHEGLYTHGAYHEMPERKLMDMPALFEFPNQVFMAVTEASVRDYAGMYLWKENNMLYGKLSPRPGQEKIKVEAGFPHPSPWRVMMIGNRVGALIESNILTNLNEPCKIGDTSWIQSGKTTFTWWNGNMVPDTTFSPGNNFATNKYYIDFAADNNLQFHSIYGYAEQPWYVDDGFDFGNPGENADVTKSIKPLDMKKICDYAKSKGVGIHVWVNWKALYAKLDEAFAQFEEWGIKGMMVDFMDRDDQEMIRIQEEIFVESGQASFVHSVSWVPVSHRDYIVHIRMSLPGKEH
ncbi:MAG: glycoside hydrolase family 97 catalytic domain-containing protein [Mangrovibacterium sp.]|nr:glycoside hydrolase family 97 catalytic domain-containing protein [Mangrovibacterium sp.]